jgi:phenylalanyl-tRNA synthetase alpha chain
MTDLARIPALADECRAAIAAASSQADIDNIKSRYLGRSGEFSTLKKSIKEVAPADRGAFGKAVNDADRELQALLTARADAIRGAGGTAASGVDPTLPGAPRDPGALHPITQTINEMSAIFQMLGFERVTDREVESPFYNFDALNIAADHPARDDTDNFYLDTSAIEGAAPGSMLVRSQTSTVQIRTMQQRKPPLRIVAPGRVYRPDTHDATHLSQFHQVEGLAVGEDITLSDLKYTLQQFVNAYYGPGRKVRFRPHFFPFTEPSFELDLSCAMCGGSGCASCKNEGYVELLGCGMVDPAVFDAVGYDATKVQGFAFGIGVERLMMQRARIPDIRYLIRNDLRFLAQFA